MEEEGVNTLLDELGGVIAKVSEEVTRGVQGKQRQDEGDYKKIEKRENGTEQAKESSRENFKEKGQKKNERYMEEVEKAVKEGHK